MRKFVEGLRQVKKLSAQELLFQKRLNLKGYRSFIEHLESDKGSRAPKKEGALNG